MSLEVPVYPNYFLESPQVTQSDTESIITTLDIFDKSRKNNQIFNDDNSDISRICSKRDYQRPQKSNLYSHEYRTLKTMTKNDLTDLYYVHYVSDQNTLQGISIFYDCPISIIKKVNKLNCILHLDDVRIRKLLLIPLASCGIKFQSTKIFNPPTRNKSIFDKNADDVEEFLQESFSNHELDCDHYKHAKDICTLPGSALSRLIIKQIRTEFSFKDNICGDPLLAGISFLSEDLPTALVKVPYGLLFARKRSESVPSLTKSSTESDHSEFKRSFERHRKSTSYNRKKRSESPTLLERFFYFIGLSSGNCLYEIELKRLPAKQA